MTTANTPTTTTDSGVLPRLRQLAVASRHINEVDEQRGDQEWEQAQREVAVARCRGELARRFPATLSPLLNGEAPYLLTGYPTTNHFGWCAVACLGEGVWLCHSEPRDPWLPRGHWPALLLPCVCGRYREAPVDDDFAVARELEHFTAHRDVCLGVCTPYGAADPAPDSDVDDGEDW